MEAGLDGQDGRVTVAADWMSALEITDTKGDWAWQRPGLQAGGWAFQYRNDHYPDVDDTAVVAMALHRSDGDAHAQVLDRTAKWVVGMQSANGGWGSFDPENTRYYLNAIPFADHGALLDPPTVDVSARCLGMLGQLGYDLSHEAVAKGVEYIRSEQEDDGSWFGRWGVNYIYGTWSVLCGLNGVGVDNDDEMIRRAVAWFEARQREDGGWGEDCATYWADRRDEVKASTPFADRLGAAGPDGGRRGRQSGGAPRRRIFDGDPARRCAMGRDPMDGHWISAGLLSQLSWLCRLFSALGAGPLPQSQARQ